jgi:hypothetical protein
MPAWIAGIQARKDASRNVLVNLDSSSPCWNDVIEGFLTEALPPVFSKEQLRRSFSYSMFQSWR